MSPLLFCGLGIPLTSVQIFGFISIGELAAPVVGGVVYNKAGFVGVFGIALAFLAVDFIMRLLLIEKKVAARYEVSGTEGGANGLAADGQDEDEEDGLDESEEDPLLKQKEEDYYKVPERQSRIVRALPILYCLRDPRLLTAQLLALTQATLLGTFDATVPTEAQDLFGFDSLKAGLLFIALILPQLVGGPVGGWTVDRYGPKPAAVFGFGYLVPMLILLRLARPGSTPEIVLYCALLALNGIGLAVIGSPSIVEASDVVQKYNRANPEFFGANGPYGQLYSINSMVFSAGLTIGPLVSGALRDAVGYGNMNIAVAALCFLVSSLSFVYIGGKPRILRGRR